MPASSRPSREKCILSQKSHDAQEFLKTIDDEEGGALIQEFFEVGKLVKTGPGQAPGLFAQYPVRREWFRPKTQKWSILALTNAL